MSGPVMGARRLVRRLAAYAGPRPSPADGWLALGVGLVAVGIGLMAVPWSLIWLGAAALMFGVLATLADWRS